MTTIPATMIRLAEELGPFPAGRPIGEELRARIEHELRNGDKVVIDFAGIEAVSPSFADELFAKLPPDALRNGHVELVNVPEGLNALIEFVVSGRELA